MPVTLFFAVKLGVRTVARFVATLDPFATAPYLASPVPFLICAKERCEPCRGPRPPIIVRPERCGGTTTTLRSGRPRYLSFQLDGIDTNGVVAGPTTAFAVTAVAAFRGTFLRSLVI
jgi:hypothetical protein